MKTWDVHEAVRMTIANPVVPASQKSEVAAHVKTALGVLGYLSEKVGFFKRRKIRKAIETLKEVSEVIANEQT